MTLLVRLQDPTALINSHGAFGIEMHLIFKCHIPLPHEGPICTRGNQDLVTRSHRDCMSGSWIPVGGTDGWIKGPTRLDDEGLV